jgi:aldehyde:ferredoxin oxidoreductase
MSFHGYHGRYLKVDLTTGHNEAVEIDESVLRRFIGGTGLGTWLLLQHCPDGVDALGAENPIIFVFSPLVGSPLTTSAKFAVMSKSPLTRRINDSLSSSSFAIAGKKTGFDAIVVTGRSESRCALVVDDGEVTLADANSVWGLSSRETEEQLPAEIGSGFRIASIGPAGENLVHFATVSNEGRHAGRGGLGAVMGSKNLKAIAVRGTKLTSYAHPKELTQYAKDLSRKSFGPATEKYRELGTVSNLLTFNRLGTLPTRNFQEGSFEGAAAISPEVVGETHTRTRASCAACTIGCEHIFQLSLNPVPSPLGGEGTDSGVADAGPKATEVGVRLEYENLFALGPLCGISDPNTVLRASRLCDELGVDTISAGGTIAFAMECAERGLIDEPELRFGNSEALLETLRKIAAREGIGELLSQGSRAAAEEIGQGSAAFAPHVKGLEIPGYEPRALQTMALGFAVGTRGADHNRSGAYQVDFSDRVDRFDIDDEAVPLAIETEDESALMDSLILCRFLRGVFDDRLAAMSEMLLLVTGFEFSSDELKATAHRIVTARKLFNIRQGWTPDEDTLPKRFLEEPLGKGASSGAVLNKERLDSLIAIYNQARGWSAEGWISEDTQRELQLAPDLVEG